MNVIASSPEGLEKYLASEIIELGGFNINTIKDQFLLNVIMPLFIEFIFFQELRFVFIEKLHVLHATTGFLYMRELEIHLIG